MGQPAFPGAGKPITSAKRPGTAGGNQGCRPESESKRGGRDHRQRRPRISPRNMRLAERIADHRL
jgi:hypothetical protein